MLVVIAVLSIVLAFPTPPMVVLRGPGWAVVAAAVATLLPPLAAVIAARRCIHLLDRHIADPRIGQYALARGVGFTHGLLLVLQAGLLLSTGWMRVCGRLPTVGDWPLVPGVIALVPFLLSVQLVWIAIYPADSALRQIAVEESLFRGRPVRPVWSLPAFLLFNLRHQVLFILAPMLLILLARDLIDRFDEPLIHLTRQRFLPDLLLGASAGLVAIAAPLLLRYVWDTRPLPDGPLRDRLLAISRRLRMRCREILVWHSGGMVVNAAVMGVLAPLRYVLISDAMLERLDDTKIEAVFGHEAGHVKRHHILFFLLFAFISGCWIMIVQSATQGLPRNTQDLAMIGIGGLLALKWGVVFFWVSRRFERQADLFGVHTLELAGLNCQRDCPVHQSAEEAAGRAGGRESICPTAAHVFGDTLYEVGLLNGMSADAWSWRHGSLAGRSRTLQRYAQDPAAIRRFEQHVAWIKRCIALTAVASGLWAGWALGLLPGLAPA